MHFLGMEDVVNSNLNYTMTVKCVSQNAAVIMISRADF